MLSSCTLLRGRGRFLLVLAGICLGLPQARAQTPDWQAVQPLGPAGYYSYVQSVATDGAGNVYVAGYFYTSLQVGATTLTSNGNCLFVAKWSPVTQAFVWAKQATGSECFASAIAVSGSSVYLTGTFRRQATFGTTTVTGTGEQEVFVAKLTDTGPDASFTWVQHAGDGPTVAATALAVRGSSVYVAGNFGGDGRSSNPAPAHFGAVTFSAASGRDAYVAKLTDAGSSASFTWAQRAGSSTSQATALATAGGASVYVAGYFDASSPAFGTAALASAGGQDACVAKLTDAGPSASFAWAQRAGGPADDYAYGLAAQGGSVYVAGSFRGTGAQFGGTALTSAGSADAFVAKLTDAGPSGSFTWAQRAGGAFTDEAAGVAVAGSGVFVTGYFAEAPATFGSTTLTSYGALDIFAAKLTDAGSTAGFSWALQAGGLSNDYGNALTVAPSGSVYVGGAFFSTSTFGSLSATANGYPAGGFLATVRDGTLATAPGATAGGGPAWPNPARGSTTVPLPAGPAGTSATLTLLDALGRVARTQAATLSAAPSSVQLLLPDLAPGVYALRVAAGAGTSTHRLVVE